MLHVNLLRRALLQTTLVLAGILRLTKLVVVQGRSINRSQRLDSWQAASFAIHFCWNSQIYMHYKRGRTCLAAFIYSCRVTCCIWHSNQSAEYSFKWNHVGLSTCLHSSSWECLHDKLIPSWYRRWSTQWICPIAKPQTRGPGICDSMTEWCCHLFLFSYFQHAIFKEYCRCNFLQMPAPTTRKNPICHKAKCTTCPSFLSIIFSFIANIDLVLIPHQ